MRFESRDLKPYAEPVDKADLKEGCVYFFLSFTDQEMCLPTLEPVVFIGRNLEPGDSDQVYFQDLASYRHEERYAAEAPKERAEHTSREFPLLHSGAYYSGSENELGHVFTYEHALDQLLSCSLRRAKQE